MGVILWKPPFEVLHMGLWKSRTSIVIMHFFLLQGTSLLAALIGSFLMTWVVFFLIQKWNEKVIKETVKSAVF